MMGKFVSQLGGWEDWLTDTFVLRDEEKSTCYNVRYNLPFSGTRTCLPKTWQFLKTMQA